LAYKGELGAFGGVTVKERLIRAENSVLNGATEISPMQMMHPVFRLLILHDMGYFHT
jgi:hypothetical protein